MCVLSVTGKHFDPDAYLEASGLPAYKVFHEGELRSTSRPGRHETSGFTVDVSYSGGEIHEQIADAIAFLAKFEDAISMLRSIPSVEDKRLDFALDLRIDRQTVMAQFDYFPPELVSRAGALGLGIEISLYPPDLAELAESRRQKPGGDTSK